MKSYRDSGAHLIRHLRILSKDERGNFAITTALLVPVLLMAAALALDISTALNRRIDIQEAADAAILRAAGEYDGTSDLATLTDLVEASLKANSGAQAQLISGPEPGIATNEICISVWSEIQTRFMLIASIDSVPVTVKACAIYPESNQVEIALVLDVSSSMIEQKRFDPMKGAVQRFLDKLAVDGQLPPNVRVSIVPFSSRVSFGLVYQNWYVSFAGKPSIPTRWTNPSSVYSASYKLSKWQDEATWLAYNGKNYYWMGCFEPRADVEMRSTGKVSDASISDTLPSAFPFVAMDSNAQSGQSFCPPPVMELSGDLTALKATASQLTSQGSTRLDVGMLAGWYTLSPSWKSAWNTGKPLDYGRRTKKYIVFMTDGAMNVKFGPSDSASDKLDWICDKERTNSCNAIAGSALLSTCHLIKNKGIKIYGISYSNEADVTNVRTCSSGPGYFYPASVNSIESIYSKIAGDIATINLRLAK